MNKWEITGDETADQLLKMLASLRLWETIMQKKKAVVKRVRAGVQKRLEGPLDRMQRASDEDLQEDVNEWLLQREYSEIGLGRFLMTLCSELDRKAVSREAIFDVLNTNRADRTAAEVLMYGNQTIHLIATLNLENSASCRDKDGFDLVMQPLRWCFTMAFMNALKTNEQLDRVVHDEVNEFFNGAFGDYSPRTLTERLTGVHT